MFAYPLSLPVNRTENEALMGTPHTAAGLICLFGILMRLLLSDPVMEVLGTGYATTGGGALSKIHPGVYFIYLSFFMLLIDRAQPLKQIGELLREQKIFCTVLFITLVITLYWALRGPKGLALILDTHLPLPIAAIVLSYTPKTYCKHAVQFFLVFMALNSLIGIAEALGKFRVLTFDPDWVVLSEEKFRASALLGHPLNNAALTSFALFSALTLRVNPMLKVLTVALYLVSLVGFGGRAAFAFSTLSVCLYGFLTLKDLLRQQTSVLKLFLLLAATLIAPLALFGGLYLALSSGMGERLVSVSSLNDPSAEARSLALTAFDYMNLNQLIFGISTDQVDEIVGRMGLTLPMSDIENPWILMIMQLGVIFFTIWLLMTALLIKQLTTNKPFMLKLTVVAYYLTASTFNSFGRKDFLYMMMVAIIVCVSRGFEKQADHSAYIQRTA